MLTWNDIDRHALRDTHAEAIHHCRHGGITPTQVAHLLAGGVLRDDVEVEAYDEWDGSQVGDYDYTDRYEGVDDDDVDYTDLFVTIVNKLAELGGGLDDLEEDQEDAFDAFELIVQRLEAVEEWQNEVFERLAALEGPQVTPFFLQPHLHPARVQARLDWEQRVAEGRL